MAGVTGSRAAGHPRRAAAPTPALPQPATAARRRRVLIAEDHTIIREGLCALLAACSDIEVVGEAADGLEAVRKADQLRPDLVLMDLSMPRMQGVEAIREVAARHPGTRIVALTMCRDEESFLAAMRAGAAGYVLKDASCPELIAAIRQVLDGRVYLSPHLSRTVLAGYLAGKAEDRSGAWDALSGRERQVLKMIAEGGTNREIAEALCLSPKTVDRHRTALMRKLDLHSTSALTIYAVKRGLVS